MTEEESGVINHVQGWQPNFGKVKKISKHYTFSIRLWAVETKILEATI